MPDVFHDLPTIRPAVPGGPLRARDFNLLVRGVRQATAPGYQSGTIVDPQGTFQRTIPVEAAGTTAILAIVTAHEKYVAAAPPPDPPSARVGAIYRHVAKPIVAADHVNTYYGSDEYRFSAIQPGGFFHLGQLVTIFELGAGSGIYKANCPGFFGKVSRADAEGPAGGPWGLVEVTPFDGEPGKFYATPAALTFFDNVTTVGDARVWKAQTFIGTEPLIGSPVWCQPIGGFENGTGVYVPQWLAWAVPNLFGHPTDADYANKEPTDNLNCPETDPKIPVAKPTRDTLGTLPSVVTTG